MSESKVKQLIRSRKDYLLPLLLAFFLNASIFGIYGEGIFSKYNFLSAFIIIVMFIYFEFMNRHRIIGGCIYFMAGIFCLYMTARYVFSADWSGSGFIRWFQSAGVEQAAHPYYFSALCASFPFFLSSVVYYFTVILYRPSFLMLGSLVPCAIYVKTVTGMSTFYLVCIAGLNAAVFAAFSGKNSEGAEKTVKKGSDARFLSVITVTCLTLFAASVIPKQGEAKYYELFERKFMMGNSSRNGVSTKVSDRSGNAGDYRDYDPTPLYNVYANELLYFRRQNFDVYSEKEHCWYPLEQFSGKYYDSASEDLMQREFVNHDDMLLAMKKGAQLSDKLREDTPEKLLFLEKAGERAAQATVEPINFWADYKISSLRSYGVSADNKMFVNSHKQLYAPDLKQSYTLNYYSENLAEDIWTANGGADFKTDGEYEKYLAALSEVLSENGEEALLRTVSAFREDYVFSKEYKNAYEYNLSEIPSDVAELAHELTDFLPYDYQKAQALEDFFQDNFTYDLDYFPPAGRNTASYFVFESRRGTCSDFATAFTLMARSVGLTVRYTEGFSPDITTDKGVYIIRAMGSHAYPEVYIRNTGWVVYEPTVSGAYSIGGGAGNNGAAGGGITINTDILMTVIYVLCAVSAIVVVVYFLIPLAGYIRDEISIRRGGVTAIILIYRRMAGVVSKRDRKLGRKTDGMTPSEISERIKELFGYNADEFIGIYHKSVFGGAVPDRKDSERAGTIYREFGKAVRMKKR